MGVCVCVCACACVSEFVVEAREEQHSEESKWKWKEWRRVAGDINRLELRLQPYSIYRFRVLAVNEIGLSQPSHHTDTQSTPPAGEHGTTGTLGDLVSRRDNNTLFPPALKHS